MVLQEGHCAGVRCTALLVILLNFGEIEGLRSESLKHYRLHYPSATTLKFYLNQRKPPDEAVRQSAEIQPTQTIIEEKEHYVRMRSWLSLSTITSFFKSREIASTSYYLKTGIKRGQHWSLFQEICMHQIAASPAVRKDFQNCSNSDYYWTFPFQGSIVKNLCRR